MTSKYTKLERYTDDAHLDNFVTMCQNSRNSFDITHPSLHDYSQVFAVPECSCYVGLVACPNCKQETFVIFNSLQDARFPVFNNTTVFSRKFVEDIGNLLEIYSLPYDEVMWNYSSFNTNVFTSALLNALWEQMLIAFNQNIAKKHEVKYIADFCYEQVALAVLPLIINKYYPPKSNKMLEIKNIILTLLRYGLDNPIEALKYYKLFLTLNREIHRSTI